MYARMVIGETNSEDQVYEFAHIYTSEVLPALQTEPGFASAHLMVEEDGRMAVSLTLWKSREDCVPITAVGHIGNLSQEHSTCWSGISW